MTSPLGKTLNLSEAALLGIPKLTLPAINQRSMQRDERNGRRFFPPLSLLADIPPREETRSRRGR